ncbi:MAG TPA: WbuC family cupin fold metalloprotein [Verrucomicrobiae bacterium]|nr:WbuC family cupin fold metalloprotein [Verrucomicrobiae bacterium]
MIIIDEGLLDQVSAAAASSPRLRRNLNFHRGDDAPSQRLLNALEPGTYVRPHRHLEEGKEETMLVVRGRMGILTFGEHGEVLEKVLLEPGDVRGVCIPPDTFHTVLSLQPGTVFFEAKDGPYRPVSDKEWGGWAPQEGTPEADAYLRLLRGLFP